MKLDTAVMKLVAIRSIHSRSGFQSGQWEGAATLSPSRPLALSPSFVALSTWIRPITARATVRFSTAATVSVPGRPKRSTSQKPAISTPTAAPALFVKYSIDRARPERSGIRRTTPALISGNVIPSRIDCGRISSAAISHFVSICRVPCPKAGNTQSYAIAVAPTNAAWKGSPIAPTRSSTMAYHTSGLVIIIVRRPTRYDPIDIPPRKITSTTTWAYALWPTNSPRYRVQIDSYITPAAPDSRKIAYSTGMIIEPLVGSVAGRSDAD